MMKTVKEKVRAPFSNYLRTYFRQYETAGAGVAGVSEADKEALMSAAFEKYFESSTLMGAPDKCARLVDALVALALTRSLVLSISESMRTPCSRVSHVGRVKGEVQPRQANQL